MIYAKRLLAVRDVFSHRRILKGFLLVAFVQSSSFVVAYAQPTISNPIESAHFLQSGFTHVVQSDSLYICALDGGIGFVKMSVDSGELGSFSLRSYYEVTDTIQSMKVFDTLLVAHFGEGRFKFYDVSMPPAIHSLGSAQYENYFMDYTYRNGMMYFAEEFKGVTQYSVDNFGSFAFVDSTMAPIRTIQLELRGDTLFALDNYHGVLRIVNLDEGLRDQLNYLWLPFEANSMARDDSELVFALGNDGLAARAYDSTGFVGDFDKRDAVSYVFKTLPTDSNYIIISSTNQMEVVSKADPGDIRFITVIGNTQGACLAEVDSTQLLVTPSRDRGLAAFAMNVADYPEEFAVYDHAGPIRALEYSKGRLYTAGERSPFEVYNTERGGEPELMISREYPALTVAGAMLQDTLFLVDNSSGHGLLWAIYASPFESPRPIGTFAIPEGIDKIEVNYHPLSGKKYFLFRSGSRYFLNQADIGSMFGPSTQQLSLGVGVHSMAIAHRTLFHYSTKGSFEVNRVGASGTLTEIWTTAYPERINEILPLAHGRFVLLFSNRAVQVLDLRDPSNPALFERYVVAGNYHEVKEVDDLIFAVGPNSVGILRSANGSVEELAHLPIGAELVTGGDGSFFISNGSSVRRFDYLTTDVGDDEIGIPLPEDFHLTKAYPNPFNATVTIAFSPQNRAKSQAEVVVYNVLGQVVRSLPISTSDLERGMVQWDGRNSGGATVSSGMYLARLVDSDGSTVANALKLILLK